jgi:hypothetical protein
MHESGHGIIEEEAVPRGGQILQLYLRPSQANWPLPVPEGALFQHCFSGFYSLRKIPAGLGLVTGHEFTRADKASKMSVRFSPCRIDPIEAASFNVFLRSL